MVGDRLGKYEIRSTLGRGAMGTVYEGWDPVISRRVAIKTVRLPDAADTDAQDELARFKREAQAAGRLHHPNIVGVFDYGETAEIAYIVMEFVDGRPLKSMVDADERLTLPVVSRIMEDLLAGLRYSHERGVIHRDIKPANLMIAQDGQAKIADFGIARIESSNMTQAGTIMGTPAYMSPEQFMGQTVDARTDLYSAGVLLFQLLTGERPFEGSMATIMHKALHTTPPRPSDLSVTAPTGLDPVVARAMARRPDDRFPTAAAFLEAFQAGLRAPSGLGMGLGDDLGSDATVVAAPPKAPAVKPAAPPVPVRRSRTPVIAGVLALLAAGGGAAWWAMQPGPAPAPVPAPVPNRTADVTPPAPILVRPTDPLPVPTRTDRVTVPIVPADPAPPTPAQTGAARPPVLAERPTPELPAQPPILVDPLPAPNAPVATPAPPDPGPVASNSADPAPMPPVVAPTVVASAALTPEALRRSVASALAGTECAAVSGDVSRTNGTVDLRGVVVGGEPEAALRRAVQDAAPGAAVGWGVLAAEGPYCPLLNLLHPLVHAGGPALAMQDNRTSLAEGDLVRSSVVMPERGHLQVDYFSSDGTVLHMHQAVPTAGGPFAAGSVQRTGEPRGKFLGWNVLPPFGTDLVIAIATSAPLFPRERPVGEQTEDYVRDLRAALDSARRGGAHLAASLLVVRTAAKR